MAPPVDTATPEGRSRERYRRIFLSSAAGVAAMGVSALVGLASVPISLAYLGKEAYGLWAVAGSVAAWVALLDPGLVQGLVIAVSEAHGRDDHEAARAYFSTAFFALLCRGRARASRSWACSRPSFPGDASSTSRPR